MLLLLGFSGDTSSMPASSHHCYLDGPSAHVCHMLLLQHGGIESCLLSLCRQLTQHIALACLKRSSLCAMTGNCPTSNVVFLLGEACRFPSALGFASGRFILGLDTGYLRTIRSSYRLGGLSVEVFLKYWTC